MLVPHHQGDPLCDTLNVQKDYLKQFEQQTDHQEQECLSHVRTAPGAVLHQA